MSLQPVLITGLVFAVLCCAVALFALYRLRTNTAEVYKYLGVMLVLLVGITLLGISGILSQPLAGSAAVGAGVGSLAAIVLMYVRKSRAKRTQT